MATPLTDKKDNDISPLLTENQSSELLTQSEKRKYCKLVIIGILFVISIAVLLIVLITIFVEDSSSTNKDWKKIFLSIPEANKCKEYSSLFTDRPHLAATQNNYFYAELFRDKLESFGIDAYLQNFTNDIYSRYNGSSLSLLYYNYSIKHQFNLSESVYDEDPTSNTSFRNQAFLGYANSGNVTGNLIYVNYASRNDFELLLSLNITLNGTIGLCRYGGSMYRGTKVYWAQQYGLQGLIIYSDPQQFVTPGREPFPLNTSLPDSGFQRGTIIDGKCPGDVSPGRASDICNKTLSESVPQIPAIPLSYGNAMRLFRSLTGLDVTTVSILNESWKGALNISYRIGGNNDTLINLYVNNILVNATTTNVIGYIPGYKYVNESILIGNHRDAWVYGAADPISGTTSLLEIARAFGQMYDDGWEPMRNIYFASWDGEEYNLIGSTDFTERETHMVTNELVAYINVDTSVSGYNLGLSSDQLLSKWLIEMSKELPQPYMNDITMYDAWSSRRDTETTFILGDGSDYVPFVHRYGIASASMGFSGLNDCYHSVYDSFKWMSLLDTDWELAKGMSLYAGLLAYYLNTNDLLPYNVTYLYERMEKWLNIDTYQLGLSVNCNYTAINPNADNVLHESLNNFKIEAINFENKINNLNINSDNDIIEMNKVLRTLPSKFLYDKGLPTRIYFKNILVAPDLDSGYDALPFPYLAYALKFECNEIFIMNAFNITAHVIDIATDHLRYAI